MPTALREYLNYSQTLRDIEDSTLSPKFCKMDKEEFDSLLSKAIEVFSKCRSKENQITFNRIENRIRTALSEIPNPTTHPATDSPNEIHNPMETLIKKIAVGVIIAVLSVATIWVLNHYLNLGL